MLILVRHGQTAANVAGLLLGRADPPLLPFGERQAAAVAAALGRPALVVSSPLRRARQSAAAFGVPVEVDERFVELDYGELDGSRPGDLPAELWDRWRADPTHAPPGGESLAHLGDRVRAACAELAVAAAVRDVVVVTHVSPIKAALAWALGAGDALHSRLHVAVASVARIRIDHHGPVLLAFNELHPPTRGAPPAGHPDT